MSNSIAMTSKKKNRTRLDVAIKTSSKNDSLNDALALLTKKRTGGATNFRGIGFQILYASYLLLRDLSDKDGKTTSIRLEGLEDIDFHFNGQEQYIQVKSSQNSIDAGTLWDLKVLQNFREIEKVSSTCKFKLVHNSIISKGNLDGIGNPGISDEMTSFWKEKFDSSGNPISNEELKGFLVKISIEKISEAFLSNEINKFLFEKFDVNIGTEPQYLKAIFYNIFEWSRSRSVISHSDLIYLILAVKDSFSKFPINPAIQNNWITSISYNPSTPDISSAFYDGKAARPEDIAKKLPVKRPIWEDEIIKRVKEVDVVVIKSSSGQGKSTLAWQVGYTMMDKEKFSIYQLQHCTSFNEATAIADFLKTRLAIGQLPLVVLDGLNKNISGWSELAEILRDQPIKLLITTREEDWVRYGSDNSKIPLKVVDISLSVQEAADIFKELKKNNKIHPSIITWQPSWEKVKDKALLIEYIFILTQGQMIEERLRHQISILATEKGSNAKLEILRFVAVADILNIRIRTSKLTEHIQKIIGDLDRNDVYRQLEREYYLKFDNKYIEGLHPVRSQHLAEILHTHIDIQETLLSLLEIVDEDYIYDFFISAPLLTTLGNDYYKSAAMLVANKTLPEIVFAIDGLMHFEPHRFWKDNKEIFDEVFKNGGFELFVYDAIPFNKLSTLQSLSESLADEMGSNIRYLLGQLVKLKKYSVGDSDLFQFLKHLGTALDKKKFESLEGIAFLFKWFKKIGVSFPDILKINEVELLTNLESKTIGESSELFHYYSLIDPEKYRQFINSNSEVVIGWVKRKTNSLSIYEKDDDIHIEYLLDTDTDKANELSMYRINIVHAFFPYYKHYCTSAIILPFPNEDIYKAVLQNAHKEIPPENLFDDFDVHINQIWAKTILDQYAASSYFEWQLEHFRLREKALELVKKATWFFEAHLEKDVPKIKSLTKQIIALSTEFFKLETSLRKYPTNSRKYFDKISFNAEQRTISDWLSSLRNFINQMAGLISPKKEQDRHLPIINLRSATYKVSAMQDSYEKITEGSYKYFDTKPLINSEQNWFERLLQMVEYYADQARKGFPSNIIVASNSASEWKNIEQQRNLDQFYYIIKSYEDVSPFIFHLPSKIIEEENLKYAVIGVSGCDIKNKQDLWDLSEGLIGLADTDIHFFNFILVDDDKEVTGAFRVNDHYFQKFKKLIEENETEENDFSSFLPIFPSTSLIGVLDGIKLKTVPNNPELESFFRMLMTIWKLTEFRSRLNEKSSIEKKWLQEIDEEYSGAIKQDYGSIYNDQRHNLKPDKKTIKQFLNGKIAFTKDEIVRFMLERSLALT
jgi:hypothetical protein